MSNELPKDAVAADAVEGTGLKQGNGLEVAQMFEQDGKAPPATCAKAKKVVSPLLGDDEAYLLSSAYPT